MGVTVNIAGLEGSIHDVRKLGRVTHDAQIQSLEAASEVLKTAVRQHLSISKYTLDELAAMDHPYARRHGGIRVNAGRPWMVHKRSGKMAGAVTSRTFKDKTPSVRVGLNYGQNRYFKFVIQGTRVMLPRDTLYQTSQLDSVRAGMMKAIVGVLGRELRTQSTVRF